MAPFEVFGAMQKCTKLQAFVDPTDVAAAALRLCPMAFFVLIYLTSLSCLTVLSSFSVQSVRTTQLVLHASVHSTTDSCSRCIQRTLVPLMWLSRICKKKGVCIEVADL